LTICFFWGRYDFSFAHDLLAFISTEQYKPLNKDETKPTKETSEHRKNNGGNSESI
jgi:hypothetical protein